MDRYFWDRASTNKAWPSDGPYYIFDRMISCKEQAKIAQVDDALIAERITRLLNAD